MVVYMIHDHNCIKIKLEDDHTQTARIMMLIGRLAACISESNAVLL